MEFDIGNMPFNALDLIELTILSKWIVKTLPAMGEFFCSVGYHAITQIRFHT